MAEIEGSHTSQWLVETDWLEAHLSQPDLVVIDGSWHLPPAGRNGYEEYLDQRIPGAVFFDIDEISDTDSDLPHMLPSPIKFSSRMRKLGLGDGMQFVIYDSVGMFSAARVWWTLRTMGVKEVQVLNGGLPKWIAEDRELDDMPVVARTPRHFTARRNATMIADKDDIVGVIANGGAQIVDARSPGRFNGHDDEPRPACERDVFLGPSMCHLARCSMKTRH